jgi:hypothetical protein
VKYIRKKKFPFVFATVDAERPERASASGTSHFLSSESSPQCPHVHSFVLGPAVINTHAPAASPSAHYDAAFACWGAQNPFSLIPDLTRCVRWRVPGPTMPRLRQLNFCPATPPGIHSSSIAFLEPRYPLHRVELISC